MGVRTPVRRRIAVIAGSLAAVVVLTGCTTETPAAHADRVRKAAELSVVTLDMPGDMWARTSTGAGHAPVENPLRLTEHPDGRLTVELTGPQLVEYLGLLDFNAHGGFMATDEDLAAAVYDALAPALDAAATPAPPGVPGPRVTVPAPAR